MDAHPLVREYFGDQLRHQLTGAWREGNRRLYEHYRALAPERPESIRAMEPLFLAVTCGCEAGLLRDALHEVYLPRIQRGEARFAVKVLGAWAASLSALSHFFDQGRWGSLVDAAAEGQRLTADDQLFVLMQAGKYLTATRGYAAPAPAEALTIEWSLEVVVSLCYGALCEWHLEEVASSQATMAEAMATAKALNNPQALAVALKVAATLGYLRHDPAEVERFTSELIELSTRQHSAFGWLQASVLRG